LRKNGWSFRKSWRILNPDHICRKGPQQPQSQRLFDRVFQAAK